LSLTIRAVPSHQRKSAVAPATCNAAAIGYK
jgi:hypothetical protein